jgi:hypothetical protein
LIWISEAQINRRIVEITARFDDIGETYIQDDGASTGYRHLQWSVVSPYAGMEQGRFQYDEYYQADGGGWEMVKSSYDFLEVRRGSRLAFHMHPVLDPECTPHVHCEPTTGSPEYDHYRFYELSIQEAIEEHMKWWASDTALSCDELRPLLKAAG